MRRPARPLRVRLAAVALLAPLALTGCSVAGGDDPVRSENGTGVDGENPDVDTLGEETVADTNGGEDVAPDEQSETDASTEGEAEGDSGSADGEIRTDSSDSPATGAGTGQD